MSTEPNQVQLGPLDRYLGDIRDRGFVEDPAQREAVERLQDLYKSLLDPPRQPLIRRWLKRPLQPVRGLYLWGGVGRGKTWLMDIFFDSLPFPEKIRLHFHRFMRLVHTELTGLKGVANPLELVAEEFASKYRVLCFDEFFVSDIGDAMLLATLLDALFRRGVTLVATSNVEPDNLYRDGLQRARFLPAIALLKEHLYVLEVDGGRDYRLRVLTQLNLYRFPVDAQTDKAAADYFWRLVADRSEIEESGDLEIEGRAIPYLRKAEDVIWFSFAQICGGPRSAADYIELAREFHTVIISGVPLLADADDLARRFITLVDEFYDRSVKLILTAEAPLDDLYTSGRLRFEFDRTRSRLLEMQSAEYLARPHKA